MRPFKWIEWNLAKIDAHALSAEEVEASFDRVFRLEERKDVTDRKTRTYLAEPDAEPER